MNKVVVGKLLQKETPNMYVITLFKDGRPTITENIEGVNNAITKGNKIAKENNAEYEFND